MPRKSDGHRPRRFASTLFDSTLACTIQSTLEAGYACATLDLQIRFLRPLKIDIGLVRCIGEVVHVGRTFGTSEAKLYDQSGKLYGHATTSCAIVAPRSVAPRG